MTASGSVLSLRALSRHTAFHLSGESIGCLPPVPSPTPWPPSNRERSALQNTPSSTSDGTVFSPLPRSLLPRLHSLRPAELLGTLADLTAFFSQPTELLSPGLDGRASRRKFRRRDLHRHFH